MLRIVSAGLWQEIGKLARQNRRRLGAVAYVTLDKFVKFGKRDTLVCDASDQAIKSGQTSVAVLRSAFRRKACLYSSPGLHAKVLIVGRTVVIGSANLSDASFRQLDEAALITDDSRALATGRLLIDALARQADRIDEDFLRRASKLEVRPPRRGSGHRRPIRLAGPRAWLVSVVPLAEGEYSDEDELVEAERPTAERSTKYSNSSSGYVRFGDNSLFRKEAKKGDLVIAVWISTQKSNRATVFAPEPAHFAKTREASPTSSLRSTSIGRKQRCLYDPLPTLAARIFGQGARPSIDSRVARRRARKISCVLALPLTRQPTYGCCDCSGLLLLSSREVGFYHAHLTHLP